MKHTKIDIHQEIIMQAKVARQRGYSQALKPLYPNWRQSRVQIKIKCWNPVSVQCPPIAVGKINHRANAESTGYPKVVKSGDRFTCRNQGK